MSLGSSSRDAADYCSCSFVGELLIDLFEMFCRSCYRLVVGFVRSCRLPRSSSQLIVSSDHLAVMVRPAASSGQGDVGVLIICCFQCAISVNTVAHVYLANGCRIPDRKYNRQRFEVFPAFSVLINESTTYLIYPVLSYLKICPVNIT